MCKKQLITIFLIIFSINILWSKEYSLDKDHTALNFKISYLIIGKVNGKFSDFDGQFVLDESGKLKSIKGKIKVDSIDTSHKKRDGHLKNEGFFNASKYPTIDIDLSRYKGNQDNGTISGTIAVLGKEKNVSMSFKKESEVSHPRGFKMIPFILNGTLNRIDLGVGIGKKYKSDKVIGHDITFELEGFLK